MAIRFRRAINTVDSHTEGNPTRVIVGGVPVPPARTLLKKRAWLWRNDDGLRRMLNFEPRGSGTSARTAVLHTRGQLPLGQSRRFEGVLGTCFTGTPVRAENRGGITYVVPRIEGRAWITGFHQFVLDPDDPLPEGFRIGHAPATGSRL